MARRSGLRSAAAKSMTRLKGHEYDRHVAESLRQINQKAFEDKEKRIDERYAAAGQFINLMDKMSAAREQDAKAERGVTQMQKETGTEVSYKKVGLGDWLKGESKFRDIGKETFTFGDTEYSKADMIAYDKTYKKNKWEDVDFDQSDKNQAEVDAQETDVDENEIKPWTYEGQKSKDRAIKLEKRKQKVEEYRAKMDENKALREAKREERKNARLEKAELKEQGLMLAGKEGSAWDKFKGHFANMFGDDKDIDTMDKDRKDSGVSNKDTEYNPDVEPASTEEIVEKYTEGTEEDYTKAVDLTEGGDVPTEAQSDIDSDVSDENLNKRLSKSPDSGGSRDYWGEFKDSFTDDKGLFQGGEKGRVLGRFLDKFDKPDLKTVETPVLEEEQDPHIDVEEQGDKGDKAVVTSLDAIEEVAKKSVAQQYIDKNQKFDENVLKHHSKNLRVGWSGKDKKEGTSMYSLYEGDNVIMENMFEVTIDPDTGMDTRVFASKNPMVKGVDFSMLSGMDKLGASNNKWRTKPDRTPENQAKADSIVTAANQQLSANLEDLDMTDLFDKGKITQREFEDWMDGKVPARRGYKQGDNYAFAN